ncbi:hypothetical protein [Paenibacillus sp. PL2-23]|uniref:hypothetical protein n=1 Tax=Paenibacillus sp. PL2-23 TaxID=2100729 RepID=UPI0030F9D610
MPNLRTFLLGLGTGIIVGALLVQLFQLGERSQDRLNAIGAELSGGAAAQESPGLSSPPEQPEATGTADADKLDAAPSTPAPASQEPSAVQSGQGELRLIHITPGMNLNQTEKLLLDQQIIEQAGEFVKQMQSGKLKVRAGYFVLPTGAGVEAAVQAVTSKPLSKYAAEQMVANQS